MISHQRSRVNVLPICSFSETFIRTCWCIFSDNILIREVLDINEILIEVCSFKSSWHKTSFVSKMDWREAIRWTKDDLVHWRHTVYPKKYAHGFCFAVLCCGYTLTDFPISITLTSLALWQSNDCPSASKTTLMNMDKYFMWIHYERLHNHNKAKHNKTKCTFLGIYCTYKLAF